MLGGVFKARESQRSRLALYTLQLVEFANEIDDRCNGNFLIHETLADFISPRSKCLRVIPHPFYGSLKTNSPA
jgi:hypothetical protein